MKRVILKFNLLLIVTIIIVWIISPKLFPETSNVCDVLLSRFQVGLYNTFSNKVNAEEDSDVNVAITFDDGFECVYNVAYPILEEYDYTASTAVIGNRIGESGYLNYKQLSKLYRDGYEILNHSYTHNQELEYDQKGLLREYKFNRILLRTYGFIHGNNIIIVPGGEYYSNHVSMAIKNNFRAVRSLNEFYITENNIVHNIEIINVYGSRSIENIKHRINKAKSGDRDIILIFHKVSDNPPSTDMYVSTETFKEIISYINQEDIATVSYSELIERAN